MHGRQSQSPAAPVSDLPFLGFMSISRLAPSNRVRWSSRPGRRAVQPGFAGDLEDRLGRTVVPEPHLDERRVALSSCAARPAHTTQSSPRLLTAAAAGKQADKLADRLIHAAVKPMVTGQTRLTMAIDDTPTQRYGPYA